MPHGRKLRNNLVAALGLAAVVIVPTMALGAPSTPDDPDKAPVRAEKRHFLKMYKVEKQLTLDDLGTESDYYHNDNTHVSCNTGDLAIDGMWRVDQVDQDEAGIQDLTAIDVFASYADLADVSKWHFEFRNNSEGRAQLKLFVTCLDDKTAENGHQHTWDMTTLTDVSNPIGATGDTGDKGTNNCPSGSIAVSPGFQWTSAPTGGIGRIVESHPETTGLQSWVFRWRATATGTVLTKLRCLISQSNTASGHHHHVSATFLDNGNGIGFTKTVPVPSATEDGIETFQIACKQHSKALLHSYDVEADATAVNFFLGMDPNPKKRAYKIQNTGTATHTAKLGVVCFNDRTTKKHST